VGSIPTFGTPVSVVADGTSAINAVVLASAIVPVVVAVVVMRVAWVWARSHDEGRETTFSQVLRTALWLGR
jgi:hypothetical protein